MRILMVNKFLYPKGGAETYTIELGKQLKKMGNVVEYFGMYDEKNVCLNRSGLYASPTDFHALKADTATYPLRIVWSNECYEKMKTLINNFKPDIIHLNNFNYQLTPSIIDAAKEKGVPVVMTAHDSQLLCPNHLLYDFTSNSICTKCVEDKNPVHCAETKCIHGSAAKSAIGTIEGKTYQNRDTYDYIDTIICPSLFMKGIYDTSDRFKDKTVHLQNYTNEYEKKDLEREDYIFYFGRLSPEKGVNNIVEVARRMPEQKFVCAGTGPSHDAMSGVSNIELVGFKKGEALYDYIRKAKLVILPSTCLENCPLAVIEAQKLGAAVVAPSYGGASELISEEYQIKDTTPDSLEAAIKHALEDGVLEKMREDNARRSTEYLLLPEYAGKIQEVYQKVIEKN